jgi:hypothetical protein
MSFGPPSHPVCDVMGPSSRSFWWGTALNIEAFCRVDSPIVARVNSFELFGGELTK